MSVDGLQAPRQPAKRPFVPTRRIRALVVDDSILTRRVLAATLQSAPDIDVVGTASSGQACLDQIAVLQPDVVTLDVEMPGLSGLDVLRHLAGPAAPPVIMVSYLTREGAAITAQALLAGAVDVVAKPGGPIAQDLSTLRDDLIRKVRAAARGRARPRVRPSTTGTPPLGGAPIPRPAPVRSAPPPPTRAPGHERFDQLVIIGASTGGPNALQAVLRDLPADLSTAYLIVQHMPANVSAALAEVLDGGSALDVREAQSGDRLTPGVALLAPGDFHARLGPGGVIHLDQGPKVHFVRPSVDVAVLSAAELYGSRIIAAVLTGMGIDGAEGASAVHAAGGRVIAEDASTCVVWSMPRAVMRRVPAAASVPLQRVASTISTWLATPTHGRAPMRASAGSAR